MERIGKYIIHKAAVTTGYAQIVFCQDPDLGIPVAVKLFDPRRLEGGPLSPAQLLARFVTEARVLAAFDHPHVVGIKTMEPFEDGRPYFVMPYLAAHLPYEIGKDVADPAAPERDRPRRMATARAVAILRQLASALAALHRRGFVHRWVKPTNVLLTAREGGAVKLADFSMVKTADRGLPMPDHWIGDTDYCAPEQRENATGVGPEADVYSLGALAYRLFIGRLPDPAQGAAELPGEFEALGDFVRAATDPDPARRPANAAAALPMLERVPAPPAAPRPTVQVVPVRRTIPGRG
jgi:serine/threonine-protein kinase